MASIILQYYNLMGPPSYIRSTLLTETLLGCAWLFTHTHMHAIEFTALIYTHLCLGLPFSSY